MGNANIPLCYATYLSYGGISQAIALTILFSGFRYFWRRLDSGGQLVVKGIDVSDRLFNDLHLRKKWINNLGEDVKFSSGLGC